MAHDIKTMEPINSRVAMIIERTGDKESALVGLCERTACHYHLVLETESETGQASLENSRGDMCSMLAKSSTCST